MPDQSKDSATYIVSEYFKHKDKSSDRETIKKLKWAAYVLMILVAIQFYFNISTGSVTNSLLADLKRQNELSSIVEKKEMKDDIKSLVWAYTTLSTKMTTAGINTQDTTKQLETLMVKYKEEEESSKEGDQ